MNDKKVNNKIKKKKKSTKMSDWNEHVISVPQSAVILMKIYKYIGKANVISKAQIKQQKDQSTSLEFKMSKYSLICLS